MCYQSKQIRLAGRGQIKYIHVLRSAHTRGLVPRTVHTKRFEEQVAGTCPKNSSQFKFVELVAGTKFCNQILWQRWLVHTMRLVPATYCRNQSQGLFPSCVLTFKTSRGSSENGNPTYECGISKPLFHVKAIVHNLMHN